MGKKGETKGQKRLSVPKARGMPKKGKKWAIRGRPGPYSGSNSVPLGFIVREMLGLARTLAEAKRIANSGAVKVNGRERKDYRFAAGLFDVIEAGKERYRVLLDRKGRINLVGMPAKGTLTKLSKVTGKRMLKKGLCQFRTNEGSTFTGEKSRMNVGDSVKIELPERNVVAVYRMKEGNTAYITGGTHVATVAKIREITGATMSRPKLIALECKGAKFQTVERNVFVVGEGKAETELAEGAEEK